MTIIYLEKGRLLRVKVKRFYCRHCFKWTQREFLGIYEKYTDVILNLKKVIKKAYGKNF